MISGTLLLLPLDERGPNFTIRSGFRSGLILLDSTHDRRRALGCEVELVDSEELTAGNCCEVILKPWAPIASWSEHVIAGGHYDYWYGRKIGEVHVREISAESGS